MDINTKRISNFLEKILKAEENKGAVFSLKKEKITSEQLANPDIGLGLFVLVGTKHYEEIFGKKSLAEYYQNSDNSLINCSVNIPTEETFVAWAHLLHYQVEDLLKRKLKISKNIELDELLMIWNSYKNTIEFKSVSPEQKIN